MVNYHEKIRKQLMQRVMVCTSCFYKEKRQLGPDSEAKNPSPRRENTYGHVQWCSLAKQLRAVEQQKFSRDVCCCLAVIVAAIMLPSTYVCCVIMYTCTLENM